MLKISVCIPAYNEETNIGQLLGKILGQKLQKIKINEIIVVISGSTDRTTQIVREWQDRDCRIKLIEQFERQGKTIADNVFLQKAKNDILVLVCADTLPKDDCLEKLVLPFFDKKVGITACRMIPLNEKDTLPGYFSHLWWRLFHRVAKEYFRAGEVLAFRKTVKKIPVEVGCDEVYLTDEILASGSQAKYVSSAVAHNMGPQTVGDILLMRRRHACLHFQFAKFGPKVYYPKTMDNWYVFKLFLKEVNWFSPKEACFGILSAGLEALSRLLALYDFWVKDRLYRVWPRSQSTKKLEGFK